MKAPNQFEVWINSAEGQRCAEYVSLLVSNNAQRYLENRLYHAFSAGVIYENQENKKEKEQLQKTIEWYEKKLKKQRAIIENLEQTHGSTSNSTSS